MKTTRLYLLIKYWRNLFTLGSGEKKNLNTHLKKMSAFIENKETNEFLWEEKVSRNIVVENNLWATINSYENLCPLFIKWNKKHSSNEVVQII